MISYITFLFYSSLYQNIRYNSDILISNQFEIFDKNNCHLYINLVETNSTDFNICYENDFNDLKMKFCLNKYDLKCLKPDNDYKIYQKLYNYYHIYKASIESNRLLLKQLFHILMKYLKSLDIRVILIGVLFLSAIIIVDKIITKKRDKINRENLQPFVDSIINKKVLHNGLSKSYVKWLCKSMMPIFFIRTISFRA